MSKTLLIVDGQNLAYRNLLGMPPLSRQSDGLMTGAAIGFAYALHAAIKKFNPTHGVVAFDAARETFRTYMSEYYKEHRDERDFDDSAKTQLAMMRDLATAAGFTNVASTLYEADDLIASYTHQFPGRVVIVAVDKDMLQLVSDRVVVYEPKKDETRDSAYVRDKWGVDPKLAAEFQAMTGDGVDNVAGVRGVGRVHARDLLNKYGSLVRAVENAFDVKHATARTALARGIVTSIHALNMTRLEVNARLPIPIEKTNFPIDRSPFVAMLLALEANAAVKRVCADYRINPGRVRPDPRWASEDVIEAKPKKTLFG